MLQRNNKKICVVVSSLADGGAEKSSAILTRMLNDLGHKVHVVSVIDKIDFDFKGELLNLGKISDRRGKFWTRLKRLKVFSAYLNKENFDFVIDNRSRNSFFREIITSRYIYTPEKTIYCVRSYNLKNSFIRPRVVSKWIYSDAYKVVAVSHEIGDKIRNVYKFKNISVIHNAVEAIATQSHDVEKNIPYVLFYGRLNDRIKNVSLLIRAYHRSKLPNLNIGLKILGNGPDEEMLKNVAENLNLKMVEFLDYVPKPQEVIENALYTVLVSKYEGFPRVLIESLSAGTPVISVNCKSGPKEIIHHGENGLLIEGYDMENLVNSMEEMILNETLYLRCKNNAKKSVEKFYLNNISKDWQKLLDEKTS